jgi:ketosteroid isomerase-like protein
MSCSSYREILNLVYRYPELIDAGDFEGVGDLFAEAAIVFEAGVGGEHVTMELRGKREVQRSFESTTRRFPDDGTPHTRHLVSNPIVEIDEEAGTATCRSYITVLQRTDDFPLQPVWSNRYEDRFGRTDGRWHFVHRRGFAHLPGDTSQHLLWGPEVG